MSTLIQRNECGHSVNLGSQERDEAEEIVQQVDSPVVVELLKLMPARPRRLLLLQSRRVRFVTATIGSTDKEKKNSCERGNNERCTRWIFEFSDCRVSPSGRRSPVAVIGAVMRF